MTKREILAIRPVARKAMSWLEKQGDTYVIRTGAPAWVRDLLFTVHRKARTWDCPSAAITAPDDYTYNMLVWVLEAIQENDSLDNVVETVLEGHASYNCELLQWFADCRVAVGFVNEWRRDNGSGENVLDDITGGFRLMVESVTSVVVGFLAERRKGEKITSKEIGTIRPMAREAMSWMVKYRGAYVFKNDTPDWVWDLFYTVRRDGVDHIIKEDNVCNLFFWVLEALQVHDSPDAVAKAVVEGHAADLEGLLQWLEVYGVAIAFIEDWKGDFGGEGILDDLVDGFRLMVENMTETVVAFLAEKEGTSVPRT